MEFILPPPWFFGYDIALQLIFGFITFLVAVSALGIYRKTSQGHIKLMFWGFLLISISYLLQAVFNGLVLHSVMTARDVLSQLLYFQIFVAAGIYAHILFMVSGLVVLLYMTFKVDKPVILLLLGATSLVALLMSNQIVAAYFLLSSAYLLFLSWFFSLNYLRKRTMRTLLVAGAFVFLFLSGVAFFFSVGTPLLYAVGHILAFVGYGLILSNLVLVQYYEQKKRSS